MNNQTDKTWQYRSDTLLCTLETETHINTDRKAIRQTYTHLYRYTHASDTYTCYTDRGRTRAHTPAVRFAQPAPRAGKEAGLGSVGPSATRV
jgi:hypothetical protein